MMKDRIENGLIKLGFNSDMAVEPCPFCGSDKITMNNTHTPCYWVECLDCQARMSGFSADNLNVPEGVQHEVARDRVQDAWNRRSDEPEVRAALLEACKKAAERGYTFGDLGDPSVEMPSRETLIKWSEDMFSLYTECQAAIDKATGAGEAQEAEEYGA